MPGPLKEGACVLEPLNEGSPGAGCVEEPLKEQADNGSCFLPGADPCDQSATIHLPWLAGHGVVVVGGGGAWSCHSSQVGGYRLLGR